MNSLFLKIVNMSIAASWLILAVILLRVVLKKAPKWINVLFWGAVAIRLLCPVTIESNLSMVPSAEVFPSEVVSGPSFDVNTGFRVVDDQINDYLGDRYFEGVTVPANNGANVTTILSIVWIVGIIAFAMFALISYCKIHNKVRPSLNMRDNIWICDDIQTPFILGIFRLRIYIPSGTEEAQLPHIIAHENAHLKRHDHWWKPLGFLVLTIHWFNPLVWMAYILLCRDIELACDEKVIRQLNQNESIAYSEALLSCSINRRIVMVCPLAFGEVGVKERVERMLNYKKPAFWLIVIALISCVVLSVCFLTNPASTVDEKLAVFIDCEIASHHQTEYSKDKFCCLDWEVIGKEKRGNNTTLYMWVLYREYSDAETVDSEEHIFTAITAEKRDGAYHLIEYWTPQDGAYYEESVKEKVPMNLWGKALDSQRYSEQQSDKLDALARGHFADSVPSTLSLNDVIILSQKGYDLRWTDFDKFAYAETGSGLYIRVYKINDLFELWIGGAGPDSEPMYIYLTLADDFDTKIDIRDGGVTEFISEHNTQPNDSGAAEGTIEIYMDGKWRIFATEEVRHEMQFPTEQEDALETAIHNTIMEYNKDRYYKGVFACESHIALGTDSKLSTNSGTALTIYLISLYQEYNLVDSGIESVSGGCGPIALTFLENEDGYELLEYWEPRDGSYYSDDIRDKFPADVQEKYWDSDSASEALKAENEQMALEFSAQKGDFKELVNGLLTTICSDPVTSSNPGDYIQTNRTEYDELLSYGESTLKFCFAEFLAGNQTDLRGHIMASVCKDIMNGMGETVFVADAVGLTDQDWFNAFYANAKELERQYSKEDLEKYYPASWILLNMSTTNGE